MQNLTVSNSLTFYNPYFSSPVKTNNVSFSGIQSIKNYPDLKQPDEYSCGPYAAANAILYLSQSGYPNLNRHSNPTSLANEIRTYIDTDMTTGSQTGTTSDKFCKGLEHFIKDKGYKCKRIEYQGVRPVDNKYKTSSLPDNDKIQSEISKGNIVLLNLGVYKKDSSTYERQYGHWVTAVGTGTNGYITDPGCVKIHDPYDKVPGANYIKFNKLASGRLIHNADDNEPFPTENANGLYEIPKKFNYFRQRELGILEGYIILEM